MRTAQLLRHQPLRHWPVFEEKTTPGSSSVGASLKLDQRALLVGKGPDSLVAVAAAERSGRSYELQVRNCDPGLPLYLRQDGISLEGSRAILDHFTTTTGKVCFRPPGNPADRQAVSDIADIFEQDYSMKEVFAQTAIYCMDNP